MTPQIGPATAGYLYALRTLEQSREHYLDAQRAVFGDSITETQLQDTAAAWDALRDRLQNDIADAVLNWATRADDSLI